MLTTIVSFLLILALLILAHELGHLLTAKASGVMVEEFGIGYPPRLLSVKRGETLYSLNLIPLGGFTKMTGEENPEAPRSLAGKSTAVRLMVLSAGSVMNLLLPILLFSIAFMVPHQVISGQVFVHEVNPGSPAETAGLAVGDQLLKIDGTTVLSTAEIQREVLLNLGNPIDVELSRAGETITTTFTPRWDPPAGEGATGISVITENPVIIEENLPFFSAIGKGVTECVETFTLFKNEIIRLFIGASALQVTGPIGIAQMTGEIAQLGISPLLEFAAFLSINLGILNLFPLPALDGGRIVFVLIEWVRRGKRVSPQTEGMIHMLGFALLISFMLLVTYQDILNIVSGNGVFG